MTSPDQPKREPRLGGGETPWTPGPWTVEDPMEGFVVRADDPNRPGKRFLICKLGPSYRSKADESQAAANARLIAASPALYEALTEALDFINSYFGPVASDDPEGWSDDDARDVAKTIRAALEAAKAQDNAEQGGA